jgi:uncharacterized protein
MKIYGLTDIHGEKEAIRQMRGVVQAADVILLVGDITNFGRLAEIEIVLSQFHPAAGRVLAVSGNCDFKEVDACLTDRDINLHGTAVTVDGVAFMGLGGSLVTPFGTPNEMSEDEVAAALEKGHDRLDRNLPFILVSHQPPYNTRCDRLSSGIHVGSHAVRKFIETYRPLACFTGHIHESVGIDKIEDTPIINPGPLGKGFYAYGEVEGRRAHVDIRPV